ARGLFDRAVTEFRNVEDPAGLAAALLGAGRVEMLSGDADHAETLLAEARELATESGVRGVAALAFALSALSAARRGRPAEALAALTRSAPRSTGARARDAGEAEVQFLQALV